MVGGLKDSPITGGALTGPAHEGTDTVLESIVTAPFCARALPDRLRRSHRNTGQSKNATDEVRTCAKGGRAADLPIHVALCRPVNQDRGSVTCGDKGAAYLKNENRVGIAAGV